MAHPQLSGKARAAVLHHHRALGHPCHICGHPIPHIEGPANQRHPLGFVVDELIPRSHGGSSTDLANTAPAHRWCNGARSNRPITPELRERCRDKIEQLTAQPIRYQDDAIDWYR